MYVHLVQAVVFVILYAGSYTLGVWSARLVQHFLARPKPFSAHAVGVALVYLTAAVFTVMTAFVVMNDPATRAQLQTQDGMTAVSMAFAAVLLPCVGVLLVIGVVREWRRTRTPQR